MRWSGLLLSLPAWVWVVWQRARYRPAACPLTSEVRQQLSAYFSVATLQRVRVRCVDRLHDPWYVRLASFLGRPFDLSPSQAAGMVFGEVVVLARPIAEADALLFHELVHVVQVGEFGLGGFVRRYLVGWLAAGRRYREIPLERQAFALEARYRADPRGGFSVEAAVRRGEGLGPL